MYISINAHTIEWVIHSLFKERRIKHELNEKHILTKVYITWTLLQFIKYTKPSQHVTKLLLDGEGKLLATIILEFIRGLDVSQHGEPEEQNSEQKWYDEDPGTNRCCHKADTVVGVAEMALVIEQRLHL